MAEIADICASRNVPLIEDAYHAPGLRLPRSGSRAAGAVGDIGCYSFFSNKNMTCGEGGMVVTQSDALADKLRALRSHGMTTLSWDRHFGRPSTYDVTLNGLNYRIDDLRASLALAAGRVRAEEFPAIAGDHCRGCAFLSLCPAKGAGSVVA